MTKRHKANVKFIVANCDCYKGQEKELASLPEDHVQAIADVERAKIDGKGKNGGEPAGNSSSDKKPTANSYDEWFKNAPEEVRERDAFAKKLVDNEKRRIATRLVANVRDAEEKTLKRNKLLQKKLSELQELEELIQQPAANDSHDSGDRDEVFYLNGGHTPSVNRGEDKPTANGLDDDDWAMSMNAFPGLKKKAGKKAAKKAAEVEDEDEDTYTDE